MSCNPAVLTSDNRRASLFQSVTGLDTTNSLTTGEAVNNAVLTFSTLVDGANQNFDLSQITVRETAATSSDVKKPDLAIVWYHGTPPTTPTPNAVYGTPVGSTYLCTTYIAEADYKRVSETVWEASITPARRLVTQTTGATTEIYAVVLSMESGGVTFASGAALSVQAITTLHNTVSQVL